MQHFSHMNLRDLNSRYSGTVVEAKSRPLYINDLLHGEDGVVVEGFYCHSGRPVRLPFTAIKTSPLRLGYINGFSYPVYVSRRPARHYKQGVSEQNLLFSKGVNRDRMSISLREDNQTMKMFFDMMNNVYPSYTDALSMVKSEDYLPAQAFCREFCLFSKRNIIEVHWRNRIVGEILKGEVELTNTFFYLNNHLKERL